MSTGNRKQDEQTYDMSLVGYARVSTEEQSLDMQVQALIRAGVHPDHIHVEKVSGVSDKRPGRDLAVKDCRPNYSTLVVWKFDRLGRSLRDLYDFVMMLDARKIGFRSLTEHVDTKTPIGKLLLAILAASAQFERDQIQERTKKGVDAAKARGVKFGQPPKITDENRPEIEARIYAGERIEDIAKAMGMATATIRKSYPASKLDYIRTNGPLVGRK